MIYLVTINQELFNNTEYKIIGVDESLSLLSSLEIVGVDTETSGLDCWTNKLLSIQLGCKEFQIVIDCSTINPLEYKEYLESKRLFIFWNAKFDLKFLFRLGIVPYNIYDGFLAEKLMYLGYPSGVHSMSLKSAGENYLNIELDKSIRGQIIYKGLVSEVIVYAAKDVEYLEEIMYKQLENLKAKGLTTAIKYENKFVIPLAYCEYCGIKLDINKWKAKMSKDEERVNKALNSLNEWFLKNEPNSTYIKIENQGDLFNGFDLTPKVTLNWNSAKQMIPIFKKYGIEVEVQDKVKGGTKDSIDAKCLKPQKDKCDLIPIYLDYKEAIKVTSTYGENFLKQVNPVSHRIHTNYSQLGADTTRITSGGKDKAGKIEYVNLLNLPADAETRACFVAEENNCWISIDYSGQETFLMASIANDKAIIKELTEGSKDIHSLTAFMSYREIPRDTPIKDIKKKFHNLRQEAKGIEFAINYGGDANTISANKGIPIEEAKKIYDSYMSGFSGLKKYQDFRRKDWWDKGYILLNPLTGHKAFIYDYDTLKDWKASFSKEGFWDYYREMKTEAPQCDTVQKVKQFFKRKSASEKQSINYPIQATGSMCLRVSMINFFEYLRTNNLLFKVLICVTPYDEINCEAPKDIAEEIATNLYNCMVKAGAFFCTRCKLDADISRNEDGSLPTHWVH
jgi:DNA polymerase I-like protein with 3'-5' exonuclease and polymerase domains